MTTSPFASEDQFLAAISARFPNVHPHMIVGRGDDCALLNCPGTMAMTTDLFVEDVHFRRGYFSPQDVGHKSLAVNLSDIAAMGGRPLGFSLGLAGPPDTPAAYWEALLDGMAELAAAQDIPLVGGDLNACAKIVVSVTLWGEAGPSGRMILREGAMPGDVLFAVGDVGLSAVGLDVLDLLGPDAKAQWPDSVAAHLRPAPKISEGLALSGLRGVRCLMDVSDGLARDLPRLLGQTLGADLCVEPDTLHPEVLRRAGERGTDPAELAVVGGEDYALLGACHHMRFLDIYTQVPGVWALGTVTDAPGITLNGRKLTKKGFDHFS